jgi:hypothetical protein
MVLLGALIVFFAIIWFKEGWKKALKVFSILIAVYISLIFIGIVFKFSETSLDVSSLILLGVYILWFIIYCIKEGYISNI